MSDWIEWGGRSISPPTSMSSLTLVEIIDRESIIMKGEAHVFDWSEIEKYRILPSKPFKPSDLKPGPIMHVRDGLPGPALKALGIKQPRYQDDKGEDWIDEFARTKTVEEFRGAMSFSIGKYNRRCGKKDEVLKEVKKVADYAQRWVQYETKLAEGNQQ